MTSILVNSRDYLNALLEFLSWYFDFEVCWDVGQNSPQHHLPYVQILWSILNLLQLVNTPRYLMRLEFINFIFWNLIDLGYVPSLHSF